MKRKLLQCLVNFFQFAMPTTVGVANNWHVITLLHLCVNSMNMGIEMA